VTEKPKNIFLTLHTTSNKTMQNVSVKLSKRGPTASQEKGGAEATAKFASSKIYPCS